MLVQFRTTTERNIMNIETIELTEKEAIFVRCYLVTVFFTETGDSEQPPADAELCTDFLRESTIDCLAFYSRISCYIADDQIEQAAHDFWYTRNGHGVGFWENDRGWSEWQSEKFTVISKSFGEANAYFEEYMV